MRTTPPLLFLLFRISVFMEFVGHGAFGIITKKEWVPFFGVAGIPESWAWKLMPVVGAVDIALGVVGLLRPCRALLIWMSVWGLCTALLRPLSGLPFWEALERAGNYGVPLVFYLATQGRGWFSPLEMRPMDADLWRRLVLVLRWTTGLLLIGHGGFGAVMQKASLIKHLEAVGLSAVPVTALGGFELALGLAVLLQPTRPVLLFVLAWKIATEMMYPLSGAPFWEFVERGGSYVAPLALFIYLSCPRPSFVAPPRGELAPA